MVGKCQALSTFLLYVQPLLLFRSLVNRSTPGKSWKDEEKMRGGNKRGCDTCGLFARRRRVQQTSLFPNRPSRSPPVLVRQPRRTFPSAVLHCASCSGGVLLPHVFNQPFGSLAHTTSPLDGPDWSTASIVIAGRGNAASAQVHHSPAGSRTGSRLLVVPAFGFVIHTLVCQPSLSLTPHHTALSDGPRHW